MAVSGVVLDRNIIVLGKTGCGKSTVSNHILHSDVFTVNSDVASVTESAAHATAKMEYGGKTYQITMIDTVGLFDTKNRTNKSIIDEVKGCMKSKAAGGLNLVLFIFKHGRFTAEEEETFQFIINNLKDKIAHVSALIITNCDGKNIQARAKIVEDFKSNDKSAPIAAVMGKGIYTVGFPDLSDMDEDEIPIAQKKITKDEEQLLGLIAKCTTKHLKEDIQDEGVWSKVKSFCSIM